MHGHSSQLQRIYIGATGKLQSLDAKYPKAWKTCVAKNFQVLFVVLRAEIVPIFGSILVTVSARIIIQSYTNQQTLRGYISYTLQQFANKVSNYTNFIMFFAGISLSKMA